MIKYLLIGASVFLFGLISLPAEEQATTSAFTPGAFDISGSGESGPDHPKLFPYLHEAGVNMVRQFPEWGGLEPEEGKWNWKDSDALVESSRKNNIQLAGILAFLAPWASSAPNDPDQGARTRTFPIKNIQYWRDFVRETTGRYKDDIQYWEVYNEFNTTTFARNGTPKDYAELVTEADAEVHKVNPKAKIGIGCADVDLSFLERVIKSGAAGHFDYIAVHPYSLIDAALSGREPVFLGLGTNLRKLLKDTGQRNDIELWVTEIGTTAPEEPAPEARQAQALVKAYTLCFAQGIKKVFWFEGRGPNYGQGSFGIIRQDWSRRPAFDALKVLTGLLKPEPGYMGWLDLTGNSYGFVFDGKTGPVLITWASSDKETALKFASPVTVLQINGDSAEIPENQSIPLTRTPIYVTKLPAAVVSTARSHGDQPFPWVGDFSKLDIATCQMGASNVENGLSQIAGADGDHNTVVELVDGVYARRTDKAHQNSYMNFDVNDSYASLGDKQLEITVVARRVDPNQNAGCVLCYESTTGYHEVKEGFEIPADAGWHEHTFKIDDANFANSWGWNFRLDVSGSPTDILVKEVRVKRIGDKK